MSAPARVLNAKTLSRYMDRHRLLDETSGTAPDRFLVTLVRRAMEFVPSEGCALLLDDPVSKEDDRSRNELTRFRYDKLMGFAWKFHFPAAVLNLLVTGLFVALFS